MTFYCSEADYNTSSDDGQNVSVKLYEAEWKYLFNITNIDELRGPAIKGELRSSRYRSICWRILLEILPIDSTKWFMVIQESRSNYERIKLIHYNDPHTQDFGLDDPLSQNDDSVWKQYFIDNELKKTIQLDVVRTSPGVEFFRTEKIQKIMIDVLFCYSRENPDLCYRQGMHEILAPLLFVLHCDHQALLHVLEQSSSDVSDLIKKILDPAYLEADVYSLFNTIMKIMKDNYTINNNIDSASEQLEGVIKITNSTSESKIVRKLTIIRDKMLKKFDPELHGHLLSLDISFTTFGVRWLRLLFGGEFSLMDLLVLWDAIFSKPTQNFALVNYVFVAMLVLLRVQLLKSDNINCLNCLMRYPPVDVMSVIEYALHIFDPMTYPLPAVVNTLIQDKSDIKTNVTEKKQERPSSIVCNYSGRLTHNSSDDLLDLCRVKLLQYHSILSPAISKNNKEARQALIGMLELCGMIDSRPGVIEMGKDVVRSTTPMTPYAPEIPEDGPVLPPPASAITMTLFKQTKKSVDSQIQGAPTKNPLKQMKRHQRDDDDDDEEETTTCVYAIEERDGESDDDETFYAVMVDDDDSSDDDEDRTFYAVLADDDDDDALGRVTLTDGDVVMMMEIDGSDVDETTAAAAAVYGTAVDECDDVDVTTISSSSDGTMIFRDGSGEPQKTSETAETAASSSSGPPPEERAKRPLNSYMLWSHMERRKVADGRVDVIELSRKLGARWRRMSDRERRPFELEAQRLRESHRERYPGGRELATTRRRRKGPVRRR